MASICGCLLGAGKELLYRSGEALAEKEFAGSSSRDLKLALEKISEAYSSSSLGELRMDGAGSSFIIVAIHDCATCANVERDGRTYCWFDAGYIAGALKTMLQKDFIAVETKCRGTGHDHCEFIVMVRPTRRGARASSAFRPMDKMPM